MKKWLRIFISAAKGWSDDSALKHSAAVSFSTLFSLAPITIISVTVAAFFFDQDTATEALKRQVSALVGPSSAEVVQAAADATKTQGTSLISTLTGIGLLLFGATTVFGQLQESLNDIWGVKAKPQKSGWMRLIIQRLLSLAMVLTIGFLLLVSLVLTTAVSSLVKRLHFGEIGLQAAELGISFCVVSVLFSLLFKVLPDVRLRWKDVWVSGAITAALFTIGRYGIALYLARSTVASIYGAAGSLVALLIWIYYSCAILFYGVEVTCSYREANGLKVEPKDTAVLVEVQTREREVDDQPKRPAGSLTF